MHAMIQYLYILQIDRHNKSSEHPSLRSSNFFLVIRAFKIHSPSTFQMGNAVLLTPVMQRMTLPCLIHLIIGNLYLLNPFTHSGNSQPFTLATTSLFFTSMRFLLLGLGDFCLFVFCGFFRFHR